MTSLENSAPLDFYLLTDRPDQRQVEPVLPLVSIVMFVRNGSETISRAIESVLSQEYPRVQLIIQDGKSTDGTIEIIRSYGDRVVFVSEMDSGVHDAFWRALQRVEGEIIGTCLSDEELMPGAIERGVSELLAAPAAAAITGDAFMSDKTGTVFRTWAGKEFDFLGYLLGYYCPHFSATFFWRQALVDCGLFDSPWRKGRKEPVEFEIWCRLGTQAFVKYVPHTFCKFGHHTKQLSQNLNRIIEELELRQKVIDDYLFSNKGFFYSEVIKVYKDEKAMLAQLIKRRQHEIIIEHLKNNSDLLGARKIEERLKNLMSPGQSGKKPRQFAVKRFVLDFGFLVFRLLRSAVKRFVHYFGFLVFRLVRPAARLIFTQSQRRRLYRVSVRIFNRIFGG